MDHLGTLLVVALLLVIFVPQTPAPVPQTPAPDSINQKLLVKKCPPMPIMKNVKKSKLLRFWYAYATTPLASDNYQRRCRSYNVKDSPYFKTNILYTNYDTLCITYACTYDDSVRMYRIKLRLLTTTRAPMPRTITTALEVLRNVSFPIETLTWLEREAFCFEWFELKFETQPRPIWFQAPFNQPGVLGRRRRR